MTWRSPLLDEIVEVVGDSAARSLVHVYPGSRVYVPTPANLDQRHPIPALIGMALAMRLSARFGGEILVMPTPAVFTTAARNAQILTLRKMGRTIGEIARQFQLNERQVWRILAAGRATVDG